MVPTKTVTISEFNISLDQFSYIENMTRRGIIVGDGGDHRSVVVFIIGEKDDGETHATDAVTMVRDFVDCKVHFHCVNRILWIL